MSIRGIFGFDWSKNYETQIKFESVSAQYDFSFLNIPNQNPN